MAIKGHFLKFKNWRFPKRCRLIPKSRHPFFVISKIYSQCILSPTYMVLSKKNFFTKNFPLGDTKSKLVENIYFSIISSILIRKFPKYISTCTETELGSRCPISYNDNHYTTCASWKQIGINNAINPSYIH